MRLFPETYPEGIKDDDTVPEDLTYGQQGWWDCSLRLTLRTARMMRLFPETYSEDSKDDETVPWDLPWGQQGWWDCSLRLTPRTARMMRLFPETYPEDSKDDETVPGDLPWGRQVWWDCSRRQWGSRRSKGRVLIRNRHHEFEKTWLDHFWWFFLILTK